MLLMIDNYDSFTFNVVRYLRQLGAEVVVVANDAGGVELLESHNPRGLIVSPGPCTPDQAGMSVPAIRHFAEKIPILGVCLGHQSIAQAFGGTITSAMRVMHGKTSDIHHRQQGLFAGLPSPFRAARYHSLVVRPDSLPAELEVSAWTECGGVREIMGIRHRYLPIQGVQFHPEAILSEHGHQLLNNFLQHI